jgi:hypothetical protein
VEKLDDIGRIQSIGDRGIIVMDTKFIRHGDRNLRRIESLGLSAIPKDLKPSQHNIVGIGESYHRHKINGQCVVYDLKTPMEYKINGRSVMVDQFVEVLEDSTITHEEHRKVPIQRGKYAILPEREIDILEQKMRLTAD